MKQVYLNKTKIVKDEKFYQKQITNEKIRAVIKNQDLLHENKHVTARIIQLEAQNAELIYQVKLLNETVESYR